MDNFSKSSQLKLFGVYGLMTKAQMKSKVLYGSVRTDDSLIVAMRKSQSVPFRGRQIVAWRLFVRNAKKYVGARAWDTDAAFSPYTIKVLCW